MQMELKSYDINSKIHVIIRTINFHFRNDDHLIL